jgi:hypothetical protein
MPFEVLNRSREYWGQTVTIAHTLYAADSIPTSIDSRTADAGRTRQPRNQGRDDQLAPKLALGRRRPLARFHPWTDPAKLSQRRRRSADVSSVEPRRRT